MPAHVSILLIIKLKLLILFDTLCINLLHLLLYLLPLGLDVCLLPLQFLSEGLLLLVFGLLLKFCLLLQFLLLLLFICGFG